MTGHLTFSLAGASGADKLNLHYQFRPAQFLNVSKIFDYDREKNNFDQLP